MEENLALVFVSCFRIVSIVKSERQHIHKPINNNQLCMNMNGLAINKPANKY